ncbi:hypothetical protein RW115_11975 [Macrococcus capreoli]
MKYIEKWTIFCELSLFIYTGWTCYHFINYNQYIEEKHLKIHSIYEEAWAIFHEESYIKFLGWGIATILIFIASIYLIAKVQTVTEEYYEYEFLVKVILNIVNIFVLCLFLKIFISPILIVAIIVIGGIFGVLYVVGK